MALHTLCMGRRMKCRADRVWHIAHCRFSADPGACSALDAPHPTKNIQRSPAGRDRSTGADSSLCNKSGSSSTLKRLVCASGGRRRTMENSMLHDAAYPLLSVPVASNYLKVYWVWRFIDFHPHNRTKKGGTIFYLC